MTADPHEDDEPEPLTPPPKWTPYAPLPVVIYFAVDWAWRLLEAIYKRIWRLEYLVRTARHCARGTWLKPPDMKRGRKVAGVWEEQDAE